MMATLLDGGTHQHTTHNRTTYEDTTIVQNQTNGFDSLRKESSIAHSPNKTRPNASIPIRTHSASADVDFPSGSQFNRRGSKTPAASSVNVPPPPDDSYLMDTELDHNETEQQAGTQSESHGPVTRKRNMVSKSDYSLTKSSSTEDRPASTRSVATKIDTIGDDFDVMDALFGVEDLDNVEEDEGNQFGFGVERERTVGGLEGMSHSEAVWGTQDSIINDSGFLPRSPPAKKVSYVHVQ